MAFSNITQLNHGDLLQIIFSEGVRTQISTDFRDWDSVQMMKEGDSLAREIRFLLQKSLGGDAVQWQNPGASGRAFPTGKQATTDEFTALFKEMNVTIELDYNVWDRARKTPEKYAEPLALETQSKMDVSKRRLAADYYGDGTGALGVADVTSTALSVASDRVTLGIAIGARGHVGYFEPGDTVVVTAPNGTVRTFTSGGDTVTQFEVFDRDRDNGANPTVTLVPQDASGAPITGSVVGEYAALVDGDIFYKKNQPTKPDLSGAVADYGTVSEVYAGLESLAAADSRVVHGITMAGVTRATRVDNSAFSPGGSNIAGIVDTADIENVMNEVKTRVGQSAYAWKKMCLSPEQHSSLILSDAANRRFQTVQDNKRGLVYYAYVHRNDTIEMVSSEFCPFSRAFVIPENKSGKGKVLEYHGTDFETVKANDMSAYHLKPASAGGYENTIQSFLAMYGVLICKHPAAIGVIEIS